MKFFLSVFVFLFIALVYGCDNQNSQLAIKEFGPDVVEAGKDFNLQPSGYSALWAKTENVTPSTVFVLNGTELVTGTGADGKGASAIVPKEMYSKPGIYKIYLTDKKTGYKSNELTFTVK